MSTTSSVSSSTPTIGTSVINVPSLVSQLMATEQYPITALQNVTTSYQAKLTALGQVKSAVSTFQTALSTLNSASSFQSVNATASDPAVLSATALTSAAPGSYSLTVGNLAQSQTLVAAGQTSLSSPIGTGTATTLSFDFGTITGNTLNAATGKYGTALTASTTTGGTTVTAPTGNLAVGATITGAGIPAGTTIVSITDANNFVISAAVTATGAGVALQASPTYTSAGSGVKTLTIDSTNNSLQGIRDAINAAKMGVTASIINDGSATPYRLVITSGSTGAANSMKISASGDATVSALLANDPTAGSATGALGQNMSETVTARNANLSVNGIAVSKASNTVSDIIPGVTVNLSKPSATPVTLTVAPDTATVTKNVNSFVTAYNALKTTLTSLTAYNASTKTAAILQGNLAILNMQSDLNGLLNTPAAGAGSLNSLSQIGVTFQRDGTLAVNNSMLSTALKNSFSSVAGLFASTGNATDSLITYNSNTSSTQPGTYPVNITQLATQGNETGSAAPSLTITAGINDSLSMNIDGVNTTITLTPKTYASAQALATELQTRINSSSALSSAGIAVSATINAGNISMTSNAYGATSSVIATGGNGLSNIFGTAISTTGVNVAGTINGTPANGSGQSLTAVSGNAQGLSMQVTGGTLGARGTVSYSQGYAYTLSNYSTSLLSSSGALTSSTNEINTNISQVAKQITALQQGLITKQALYTAQYTALNNMMTTMNSTSTFLTQQLSKL
jgi:flagellar hook-associated protein 2